MRAISEFYIENGYDPSYLKWITLAAGQRIDNGGGYRLTKARVEAVRLVMKILKLPGERER